MPAASETVGAPGGGGDVEQEHEIRNDEGFVYKVPRGLYPDAAPSTTQSVAGRPDPKAAGLRRRRRALLRLRAKRLRDLSRWEALASELLLPLPAPQPPAPPQLPAPLSQSLPVAASSSSSSSASVLDELLVQVDIQTELMKKVNQWCDEANAICDAGEAAIVDSMLALPLLGGNPADLVAALSEDKDPVSGVNSAADEMIKNGVGKKAMVHDLPPILTESRMRKRGTNLSDSIIVAPPTSIESKRKKASGSTSTAPATPGSIPRRKASGTTSTASGTPGPTTRRKASGSTSIAPGTPGSTTRRKATSTPARAPDIVCSQGPLTRRGASQKEGQQLTGSLQTALIYKPKCLNNL